MHFLRFIVQLMRLMGSILFHMFPSKKHAQKILHAYEKQFQGKFEPAIIREITDMQFYAQVFVMDGFTGLSHRLSNQKEKQNNIYYFIIMILHDALLDGKILTTDEIDSLVYYPESHHCNHFYECVLTDVLIKLKNNLANEPNYMIDFEHIHAAQKKSLLQFEKSISIDTLVQIAKEKGGYTFLIYKHFLQLPYKNELGNCLFGLGGLIQMTDDLLDIHKDATDGIHTFANSLQDTAAIESIYHQQWQFVKEYTNQIPATLSQKRKLQFHLSIIAAFGLLAIRNLYKIQSKTINQSLPPIPSIERKSWIIDMEKPRFIFQYLKHLYQISR